MKLKHLSPLALGSLVVLRATIEIPKAQTYTPIAGAFDAFDGNVPVTRVSSTVNPQRTGTYTDTWEATDRSGNTTRLIRTVIVRR